MKENKLLNAVDCISSGYKQANVQNSHWTFFLFKSNEQLVIGHF